MLSQLRVIIVLAGITQPRSSMLRVVFARGGALLTACLLASCGASNTAHRSAQVSRTATRSADTQAERICDRLRDLHYRVGKIIQSRTPTTYHCEAANGDGNFLVTVFADPKMALHYAAMFSGGLRYGMLGVPKLVGDNLYIQLSGNTRDSASLLTEIARAADN